MPIGNSHADDITGSEAAAAERFGSLRRYPKQHSQQQTHIYTNTGEKHMPPTTIACPTTRPTLSAGATGGSVVTMQQKINARLTILGAPGALTLLPNGNFGPQTLKAAKYIQCVAFLDVDGIVGPMTWAYLCDGENSLPVIAVGNANAAVITEVQRLLQFDGYYAGSIDGIFGPQTKAAVMAYQASIPLPPVQRNGVIRANTWVSLVRRKVTGGSCNV
jgi:peptidoglycan hydrolase-like protein with peptidoglycan-binding domain